MCPFSLLLPLLFAQVPAPTPPDFKVVFWLDGATLHHQAYDVRKGQYTPAVEDWLRQQRPRFDATGYAVEGRLATVRDVYLAREPGRTEPEKLEAAIARESRRVLDGDVSQLAPPPPPPPGLEANRPAPVVASRPVIVSQSSFYQPPRAVLPWPTMVGGPSPGPTPLPSPAVPRNDRSYLQPPPAVPIYLLARPR
jgi:hypothetical protein